MSSDTQPLTGIDLDVAADLAAQLRVDSIRASTSAGSGHPTSSMSAADLLAVLVGRHLRYDWDNPHADTNDHLIFSKGHASPLLYSVFKAVGVVSDEELMTGYRARRTATRWPRSARTGPRSWRSTARSATPPTPTSSPGPTPGASSRCSSPSSRWWRPR